MTEPSLAAFSLLSNFSENLSSIDKHSRILVLTGYHGLVDGSVGEKDSDMHEAIDFAVDLLFKDHENILQLQKLTFSKVARKLKNTFLVAWCSCSANFRVLFFS